MLLRSKKQLPEMVRPPYNPDAAASNAASSSGTTTTNPPASPSGTQAIPTSTMAPVLEPVESTMAAQTSQAIPVVTSAARTTQGTPAFTLAAQTS
jgi:hypothetical protein